MNVTSILPHFYHIFVIHVRSFGAGAAQHGCEDECASQRCAGVGGPNGGAAGWFRSGND